jgi:hypothetical protein
VRGAASGAFQVLVIAVVVPHEINNHPEIIRNTIIFFIPF